MQLSVPAIQPVIGGAPAGSYDTATMACGIGRPGVNVDQPRFTLRRNVAAWWIKAC